MDMDNEDIEYIARVQSAYTAMHCPACGAKAALMAYGWNWRMGAFVVAPVFSCDTPDCEFNHEADTAWTPASTF